MLSGLLLLIVVVLLLILSYVYIESQPLTCPKCKREIKQTENWSYGDYSWGSRCPHCKYEFDMTP